MTGEKDGEGSLATFFGRLSSSSFSGGWVSETFLIIKEVEIRRLSQQGINSRVKLRNISASRSSMQIYFVHKSVQGIMSQPASRLGENGGILCGATRTIQGTGIAREACGCKSCVDKTTTDRQQLNPPR